MVYSTEKILNENRAKIDQADAKAVEEALEDTKKAIQSGNLDEIRSAKDKLTQVSHKMAEAMYRAAGPQAGGPGGDGGPGAGPNGAGPGAGADGRDNVVDAEFVDVDDKK
jgi:molecular chaperone DnaK